MARILFGPWEPDKPAFLAKGARVARNVLPADGGYRPIQAPVPLSYATLPDVPAGAVSTTNNSGATQVFAGTATALYRLTDTGFVLLDDGYATSPTQHWRFIRFGGLLLATNGADPVQKIDLTTFAIAPLGGMPPTILYPVVVKDFVVGGLINGQIQTVAWSGINDAEWWTFGSRQSDYQMMPTGGRINGMFGGEVGLVLQRSRVSRMTYVGDNVVFQFDEISSNVGCANQNSVVQWGALGFFLSNAGFMMWDGAALKPIGQERVDRYLRESGETILSTAVDAINNTVVWSTGTRLFLYHWLLDRWSDCSIVSDTVFTGTNRNDLADADSGSRFYVFDGTNTLCALTGANLEATLTATAFEIGNGRAARIRLARPIGDALNGATVTLTTADRLGQNGATATYSSTSHNGDVPIRQSGRYVVASVTYGAGADWTFLQGLDLTIAAGARR